MITRPRLLALAFGMTAASFAFPCDLFAQIEVPVSYELASGAPRIDGFLTGGSWCEPEGLSVTRSGDAAPSLVRYEDIDQITALTPPASGTVSMRIRLKEETEFQAVANVPPGVPMLVLRDEPPQGAPADSGKIRTFTPENFRGLPSIEFEAALALEASPQLVKELAEKLAKAAGEGRIEEAIELHSQIGEILGALSDASGTAPVPE
ncbi:MAG TPA: hypothetical protein PLP29_15685 [Candidatus Ozemobacteraceae bacterium]|nr:hypothetical protein [Candidatus Ozemobacteraceae bacterium]